MSSYYFHKRDWSIDTTPPGVRLDTFSALVIALVLSLLFVVFLPVLGFWMIGRHLLVKSAEGMAWVMSRLRVPRDG